MSLEVKEQLDQLHRTISEFKSENDKRIEKLEKGKHVDPLHEEKVNRANAEIDKLIDQVKALQTAANRPALTPKQELDEKAKAAKAVMNRYMKRAPSRHMSDADLKIYAEAFPEEWKTLSVQDDSQGGYLVRPEVSNDINMKVYESSPIRQEATVITIGSDAWEEPGSYTKPTSGWVAELGSRTTTTPAQTNLLRIPVHEIYSEPPISQKMLDDAIFDVEAWHQAYVGEEFALQEATAFVTGSGVGKPMGFTQYASGTGWNQIEQVNLGSNSDVTGDGLISLQNTLFERFQLNAKWYMQRASFTNCRKLKDQNNRYLFDINTPMKDALELTLLGKPVVYCADMASITSNALAVAYGDMRKAYYVIDRAGIRVLRDPYTTKGSVLFYTTKRVGGGVRGFQALKLGKIST